MDLVNSPEVAAQFWSHGYVVLRGIFSPREVGFLRQTISTNQHMNHLFRQAQTKYKSGKYPSFETIFVWNDTSGDDIFAKFTRSNKLIEPLADIFQDDIYVYHNKVALKYSDMPGFKYHQDYFYWYQMGCLYPDMATCYIAIDPATRENGCLRLIEGSHRLGRVEHVLFDGISDSSVDPERLEAIKARMPEKHIELEPGDCVIFHCNTLHASDTNQSKSDRLALLGCYNTRRNDPYIRTHDHPNFIAQTPVYDAVTDADVEKLPDFFRHYREEKSV